MIKLSLVLAGTKVEQMTYSQLLWYRTPMRLLFSSLNILCPSVAFSNIMAGSVSSPISGHRAIRLRHCIILINTSHLFPIHILLARPLPSSPNRIPSCYHQHIIAGDTNHLIFAITITKICLVEMYWATLLWCQVIYYPIFPCRASASASYIKGLLLLSVHAPRHLDRSPPCYPIM